jgi:TRAP-type C4-dicarboxylate transport system substrate-binding protein
MRMPVAALVAALVLSGCSFGSSADKSGGDGPPVIVHMATNDEAGSAMDGAYAYFAHAVHQASDGRLRITISRDAADGRARYDQAVAGKLQQGEYDLALVPARSWDALEVSSLRPLQTPFLVDSDDLVDEIVKGDVADRLMSGLPDAGVHGLVLWPESLRHPVGFGRLLLTREDFHEATLRAPYSEDVYAMLRALGSRPVNLTNSAANAAYAAGRLQGAETGTTQRVPGPPGTMTADVTFYARIDTIAANDDFWEGLTGQQRADLTQAAEQTRDWLVVHRAGEDEALQAVCDAGLGVTRAGPEAVADIQTAAAPVAAKMRAEPDLGPLIDELEALKADVVPGPSFSPECAVADQQTEIGPRIDPAVLDGTYRASFTDEELLASGADGASAASNTGMWTITFDGGHYSAADDSCTATYELSATMIAFRWDPDTDCTGDWTARWERTPKGIRFSDVQSPYPVDRALWGLHEWMRLAE